MFTYEHNRWAELNEIVNEWLKKKKGNNINVNELCVFKPQILIEHIQ